MSAYVVAHFTVDDQDAYGRYAAAFFPIFDRHHGKLVAVDDDGPILEGSVPRGRTVVLEFPDKATATAWWNDPDYQKIAEDRRAGTTPYVITIIGDRPLGWTGG